MKLPDKVNPVHCVTKDDSRYVLKFIKVKGGLAVATDGKAMLITQVAVQEDDTITEGLVPTAAIKQAMKNKHQKGEFKFAPNAINPENIDVEVPVNLDACTTYYGRGDLNYPNALKVIPDHERPLSISLDAKLLAQLAAGLGMNRVTITVDVDNPGTGYIVTSAEQTHAFAVLMPARDAVQGVEWEPAKNVTLDMARAARDLQPEASADSE